MLAHSTAAPNSSIPTHVRPRHHESPNLLLRNGPSLLPPSPGGLQFNLTIEKLCSPRNSPKSKLQHIAWQICHLQVRFSCAPPRIAIVGSVPFVLLWLWKFAYEGLIWLSETDFHTYLVASKIPYFATSIGLRGIGWRLSGAPPFQSGRKYPPLRKAAFSRPDAIGFATFVN